MKTQNKAQKKTAKFQTPHEAKQHGGKKVKSKKTGAKAKKAKPGKGKLGSLLGHSVISVVRAMGKHGWTFDEADAALRAKGIKAAKFTITRALMRGKRGQKKIAPLSAKELATLDLNTPAKKKSVATAA